MSIIKYRKNKNFSYIIDFAPLVGCRRDLIMRDWENFHRITNNKPPRKNILLETFLGLMMSGILKMIGELF